MAVPLWTTLKPAGSQHGSHRRAAPGISRPGLVVILVTARTVQGMARVRSGQAPPGPCRLTGVPVEVSRVKRDFTCTLTRHFCLRSLPCGHSHA